MSISRCAPSRWIALSIGLSIAGAAGQASAATLVQPDIRVGATYQENAGFSDQEEVSASGAEIDARLNLGFIDERGSVIITPMIRYANYDDRRVVDREEKRIDLNWRRNFQTAATNTLLRWQQQDLFSTEFRDESLDPGSFPDSPNVDSGFVDQESTRDRLFVRQDIAKAFGERSGIALGADYTDVSFDDAESSARVGFSQIRLDAAFRRALTERAAFSIRFVGQRYDGGNEIESDVLGGGVDFEYDTSETGRFYASAGYANIETDSQGISLPSESALLFRLGATKETELTRFRVEVEQNIRPTSIGGLTEEVGARLFLDRRMSARTRLGVGVGAFRQERNQVNSVSNDRDYFSGQVRLSWQISQKWFFETSVRYRTQEFDSDAVLNGSNREDRTRFLLNLRYRGLSEVLVQNDRRFLRGGF